MDTLSKADEAMTAAANGTPNEALSNLLSLGRERARAQLPSPNLTSSSFFAPLNCSADYREVQLDFTPEMEVFYMMFVRSHTRM